MVKRSLNKEGNSNNCSLSEFLDTKVASACLKYRVRVMDLYHGLRKGCFFGLSALIFRPN